MAHTPLFARKLLKLFTLVDLCASSLRRGHASLLCVVPVLTDAPRRESKNTNHHDKTTTDAIIFPDTYPIPRSSF